MNKKVVPGEISNKIKVKTIENILAIDISGLVNTKIKEFLNNIFSIHRKSTYKYVNIRTCK